MTTSVWYLLASLLLASVAGQLYDRDSESFYENFESSSPAPQSSPSAVQQAEGEEIIIYLTSEQAEVLKAAGAVVQPLPELNKEFQQKNKARPEFQPSSTEDSKEDKDQDDYFKALNIEQRERETAEDSTIENQSDEEALGISRNYKDAFKTRQQEYFTPYASKKLNKDKSEYVRYLPSQEIEKLKTNLYRTQPRAGYFDNRKLNTESQGSSQTKTPEPRKPVAIKNVDEFRQVVADIKRFLSNNPEKTPEVTEGPEEDLSNIKDKGSVTIQNKSLKPAKVWEPAQESSKIRKNKQAEDKLKVTITNSHTIRRQYSSLLAALGQQEKITQSIDEQNEELLKNQRAIKTKLQQIKDNDEIYATEIDKLNKNIVKYNQLAQKLASEAAAQKSRTQLSKNSEVTIKRRGPIESENQDDDSKAIPVLVKITRPSEWRWRESTENFRPIPVPVLQNEKTKVEKPNAVKIQRPVPIPVARQYYVSTGKPYTLKKGSEYKPEIPSSLAIIRQIWDNQK